MTNTTKQAEKVVIKLFPSFPAFLVAGLVLLILKLSAYPGISWLWVIGVGLAPLWIGLSVIFIVLGAILLVGFVYLFAVIWEKIFNK